MTTQELKNKIEKVLGNSIRCLLPSYWWKNLFHSVADRIDEVEKKVDDIVVPTPTPTPTSASSVLFFAPLIEGEELSAESKSKNAASYKKVVDGFAKYEFYDVKILVEFAVIEATVISNPAFTNSVLKLMYEVDSKILILSVSADGSVTLEEADNSNGLIFGKERYAYVSKHLDASGNITDTELTEEQIAYNKETNRIISDGEKVYLSYEGTFWMYVGNGNSTYFFSTACMGIPYKDKILSRVLSLSSDGDIQLSDYIVDCSGSETVTFVVSLNGDAPENYKARNAESYTKVAANNSPTNIIIWYSGYFYVAANALTYDQDANLVLYATLVDSMMQFVISKDGSVTTSTIGQGGGGGTSGDITIDTEMSDTSTNAVQNKVIKKYVDDAIANAEIGGGVIDTSNFATKDDLNTKQDIINDLDTIRSGAAKGATAIQKVKTINGESIEGEGNIVIKGGETDTSNLATKDELNNLTNEIIANEEVHAAALNDLNERKADKEYVEEALKNMDTSSLASKEELEALRNEVITNEEIVASSLNDLEERKASKEYVEDALGNVSVDTSTLVTKEEFTDVEEVWAASYNLLNQKISDVQQYIYDEAASRRQFDEAIAEIQSILLENEAVVTAAWNQLNTRINALEAAQAQGE